jgi:hypothetical protein
MIAVKIDKQAKPIGICSRQSFFHFYLTAVKPDHSAAVY